MADEWYFTSNGQQMGPVSGATLRDLAVQGQLKPTDLVWRDGMSAWTPASATRGLFPSQPPPLESIPEVQPASARVWRRYAPPPPESRPDRPVRRPIESQGMSTGVKLLIAGAVASILCIGGLFVILVAAAAMAPNAGPVTTIAPPPRPGGVGKVAINQQVAQTNTYTINFRRAGEDVKMIQLRQGQAVRITVTTTKWGGPVPPDIDLFVEDANGMQLFFDDGTPVCDDGPSKDCVVTFTAPYTGAYQLRVENLDDDSANCTVRY